MTVTKTEVNRLVEEAMETAEDGIVRPQVWSTTQQETGRENIGADDYMTSTEVNDAITAAINQITIADDQRY